LLVGLVCWLLLLETVLRWWWRTELLHWRLAHGLTSVLMGSISLVLSIGSLWVLLLVLLLRLVLLLLAIEVRIRNNVEENRETVNWK
jgi:hypothetical protein